MPILTGGTLHRATALPLPTTDLAQLKRRVALLAENRPAVYRMTDSTGRTIYVGKAKRLRARLMTYFRARYPDDKASRILHAAADITWQYVPSEFAAYLGELRQIRQHRPVFNVRLNRARRAVFVKLVDGPAPKLSWGASRTGSAGPCWGPFTSSARVADSIRTLNDILGLRDCRAAMPIVFAEQGDLFDSARRAACMRHELGMCGGPCAGFMTEAAYRERIDTAVAFLEGRTIQPIDRIVTEMQLAGEAREFERAARWREKFEALEWLFAAGNQARAAIELLTFVYHDPGTYGDDRAYLIRQGIVRACFPYPATPIEREAFCGVVADELALPAPVAGALPPAAIDEILLIMSWFRRHPDALRRTTNLDAWRRSGETSATSARAAARSEPAGECPPPAP